MTIPQPIASLPWYDLRELRTVTDALWQRIAAAAARRGLTAPTSLCREIDHETQWRSARLLLSQACGYDVVFGHRENLRVVATPRYLAEGCVGARYASWIVVAQHAPARQLVDLRGGVCAANQTTSHSGMNALRALIAPLAGGRPFFREVRWCGAHEQSLGLIRQGLADVAAIDCVTHALLARHRPQALHGTRILASTPPAAAPPFVTSSSTNPATRAALRAALHEVMVDPEAAALRAALLLDGVEELPPDAYAPIAALERDARERGYPTLA